MADSGKASKAREYAPDQARLKAAELNFMREIERENAERALKLRKLRKTNTITGAVLGVAVFSIYAYSMYAVRQETFLDDFNQPEKIAK